MTNEKKYITVSIITIILCSILMMSTRYRINKIKEEYDIIFDSLTKELNKQKYTLHSIPTYDSLGNLYGTQKTYDHLPTHEDSVQFNIESEKEINDMIDSNFNKN
jgi:hypothetical protein